MTAKTLPVQPPIHLGQIWVRRWDVVRDLGADYYHQWLIVAVTRHPSTPIVAQNIGHGATVAVGTDGRYGDKDGPLDLVLCVDAGPPDFGEKYERAAQILMDTGVIDGISFNGRAHELIWRV